MASLSSNEPRISTKSPENIPLVLTYGLTPRRIQSDTPIELKVVSVAAEVLVLMGGNDVAALVLGPDLTPDETLNLLQNLTNRFAEVRTPVIVLAESPAALGDFINSEKLFYYSRWPLPPDQISALIEAAVARFFVARQPQLELTSIDQENLSRVLDYSLRLSSQEDPEGACALMAEGVRSLLGANHAQCLIYDGISDSFLHPGASDEEEAQSAAIGLASYVLRTGEGLRISGPAADCRFDAELDNPGGHRDGSFLCEPVPGAAPTRGHPMNGQIVAILTAARAGSTPFSLGEMSAVRLLAQNAGPFLASALMRLKLRREFMRQIKPVTSGIFRQEALDFHEGVANNQAPDVPDTPRWLTTVWRLALVCIVGALASAALIRIPQQTSGRAVVHARDRWYLLSPAGGVVSSLKVSEGDWVHDGDVLALIQPAPDDPSGESVLEVKALRDGAVNDLRLSVGETVRRGDPVLDVVNSDAGYELTIELPGEIQGLIHEGLKAELLLDGFPQSGIPIVIRGFQRQPVPAGELTRIAGVTAPPSADSAFIIATARLPAEFTENGTSYRYRNGMTGAVSVSARSTPAIFRFMPRLSVVLNKSKDGRH